MSYLFRPFYGTSHDYEPLNGYLGGEFYPVLVGDEFSPEGHGCTYAIVGKLGYGGFSTVWLATKTTWGWDDDGVTMFAESVEYVALKVNKITYTTQAASLEAERVNKVHAITPVAGCRNYNQCFLMPSSFYSSESHVITPMPVGGMPLKRYLYSLDVPLRQRYYICRQCVSIMTSLLANNIGIRDFTSANILIKANDLNKCPLEAVERLINSSSYTPIHRTDGRGHEEHVPRGLHSKMDWSHSIELIDTENPTLVLIDVGKDDTIVPPVHYVWPECFNDRRLFRGQTSPKWTLTCLLFEILMGRHLWPRDKKLLMKQYANYRKMNKDAKESWIGSQFSPEFAHSSVGTKLAKLFVYMYDTKEKPSLDVPYQFFSRMVYGDATIRVAEPSYTGSASRRSTTGHDNGRKTKGHNTDKQMYEAKKKREHEERKKREHEERKKREHEERKKREHEERKKKEEEDELVRRLAEVKLDLAEKERERKHRSKKGTTTKCRRHDSSRCTKCR